MVSFVLAHSPLTGPAAWGGLPESLAAAGHRAVVLDVRDDDEPPYAARYVASAALQVEGAAAEPPVFLVGHSGAGYLLPQLGAAQRSARRPVRGYVFVDAGVPHARAATRIGLYRTEDTEYADGLVELLDRGGTFPDWTDDDLRELVPDTDRRVALVASLRPRGRDYFEETLPFPSDWPDAPCGYLKYSAAYDNPARVARSRGWPVLERAGGHFAPAADPDAVAADLAELVSLL